MELVDTKDNEALSNMLSNRQGIKWSKGNGAYLRRASRHIAKTLVATGNV